MRLFGFRITPDADIDDTRLSILDHLEELRGRILKSLAAVLVFFPLCWIFCSEAIDWFLNVVCADLPRVQTLAVMELFFTQMKVSFFMALVLAYPVVAFQAWRFVAPGLYRHERHYVSRFVVASTALFICGAELALFYVFPKVVAFGAGMAKGKIEMTPQLSNVISLAAWLMLGFGVMFQLPIVVYLLAITGLVSVDAMRKARPIIVISIFTLAAILTPTPDIVTQCALAIPSYLLFEASIIFTDVAVRRKRRREEEEKQQEEEEERQRQAREAEEERQRQAASTAVPVAAIPAALPPAAEAAPAPATVPSPDGDVTAPAEPPGAPAPSPSLPTTEELPTANRTGETPNYQTPGQPAEQASWERWYGNVEAPTETATAAAPAVPAPASSPAPATPAPAAAPATASSSGEEETLGSGTV